MTGDLPSGAATARCLWSWETNGTLLRQRHVELNRGAGGQAPFHLRRKIRGTTLLEDVTRLREAFRHSCPRRPAADEAPPDKRSPVPDTISCHWTDRRRLPRPAAPPASEMRVLSRGHEDLGNQPGREPFEHPQPTLPPPSVELINADIDLTPQRLGVDNSQLENVAP